MRPNLQFLLALSLLLASLSSWGQKDQKDDQKSSFDRAMEMREMLHKRLRDHLFHGLGSQDDIFQDMERLFEDVMKDMSDLNLNSLSRLNRPKSYEMAWMEDKEGRTLLLSPRDKGQRLEINVENSMITIKGQSEEKIGNSISASSFTHSYSVPGDCDPTKVKMLEKDGKILMSFPFKTAAKEVPKKAAPKKDERLPISPSDGDVTI